MQNHHDAIAHSLFRLAIVTLVIIATAGCVTFETGKSFSGVDACPNVGADSTASCLTYIEFRDSGLLHQPSQVDELVRRLNPCQNTLIVLFAHGWKGGSRETEPMLKSFRKLLTEINPRIKDEYETFGVFVSWRGQSWKFEGLAPLTFGARRNVAKTIGQSQFHEVLHRLSAIRRQHNTRGCNGAEMKFIVFGHSLGGSIVYESIWREIVRQAVVADIRPTQKKDELQLYADRVILLNPAIAASDYAPFFEGVRFRHGLNSPRPAFEIYSSNEDEAIHRYFSAFRHIETMTYDPNESRDLLVTPVSGVDQFSTHQISVLSCDLSQPTERMSGSGASFPARVVRAAAVPGFQEHNEIWNLAADCVESLFRD